MNHSTNRKTKDKEAWRGKERLLPEIIWQLKTWVACISTARPFFKGQNDHHSFFAFHLFPFHSAFKSRANSPSFPPPRLQWVSGKLSCGCRLVLHCKGNLLNPGNDSWLRDWPALIRAPSSPPLFHFQLFYQGFPLPKTDIPISNLCQIQTSHFLFNL